MTTPFVLPQSNTYSRLRKCAQCDKDKPANSGVEIRQRWVCGSCWIVRKKEKR